MALTQNNKALLHRKEWQMMCLAPTTPVAGSFVITDKDGKPNLSLYFNGYSTCYLYHHDEDAFVQVANSGLAGTFGVGACGDYHQWSRTFTANGGSTTTITVAAATHNLTGLVRGKTVEFLNGANIGLRRTITEILTTGGGTGTITLTLDSPVTAVVNADTFKLNTGRFFVMGAGTVAAGIFKEFDIATQTWSGNLGTTNLPASWGTDGSLVSTFSFDESYATGTATSATSTTLVNTPKTWTVNQWCNYQVRIVSGTGIGQRRNITSNTANTLTVPAWTITPDATSVYAIEGSEDYLYLLGNNAVTMYRYSISANTWTALAPTTARSAAPGAGMGGCWICITGDVGWANESDIRDGRYIYSIRGGASAAIDRFDIAGGTAGAGAWQAITYNSVETFTTGTSSCASGRYIFVRKDATHRFFKFSVRGNYMEALSTNMYPDGTALVGKKILVKDYDGTGIVKWLYSLRNSGTEIHRLMLF